MKKVLVHDRVGVQGQPVPVEEHTFVDIPEEYNNNLSRLRLYIEELNNARVELGRLSQIMNHLVNVCNTAETNVTRCKKEIIEGMQLGDGNWAIDFDANRIGRVSATQKEMPRVV